LNNKNKNKMVLQEKIATIQEIRAGRNVFIRNVLLGDLDQDVITYELVFVHGICGTEKQFQLLMEYMDQSLVHVPIKLSCLLFDSVGCGKSPILHDWDAYQKKEIVSDLDALMQTHLNRDIPTIFVGHSYGPSIFLSLLSSDNTSSFVAKNLAGCIYLGSSIRMDENPQKDRGHPIMTLPIPILKWIQPSLTKAFVEVAVHPDQNELRQLINQESNKNNMLMAKA
jgi:pimeloyl-ACP methyl ester carboxylesterase